MKKKIILSIICLSLLCGCGKVPKLQNGEEAVITFAKDKEEHKISAEELYKALKDKYGLMATINMIDTYILETEFPKNIDKAKESAENYIKTYIESYGSEEELLKALQQYTNYSTIDAYKESLYINFMQSYAMEEYAKTLVTDKEINTYYKDKVEGDIEIYHILVTPDVKDSMSDEEKTEAENKAKDTINEIIKKLDESKDKLEEFKKLVKEYSEDDSTKEKDGNLGYLNYGDLDSNYDELIKAAYKLKNGEYSKSVIVTELGYHVIYRNSQKEKDALDDIKDKIIETLSKDKIDTVSTIALDSIKYYRKLYNTNIVDSELNKQYGIYMNNLANSNTSSQ